MKYMQGLSAAVIIGLCTSATAFAANVSINGTIPGTVVTHQSTIRGLTSAPSYKQIVFQRVILSDEAKANLAAHVAKQLQVDKGLKAKRNVGVSESTLLGMNGVPVLDQGQHGSCVTFAVTGAIDATIDQNKKDGSYDRYSQLCSLELGSTLENESPLNSNGEHTYPSGWDGSWASIVLNQISQHGLITKNYQETKGCAGVREYNLWSESDRGRPMKAKDYDSNSEKVIPPIKYKMLMSADDAFTNSVDTNDVLNAVKKAISSNHRVTFGTLLDIHNGDFNNGAFGSYKVSNDTWILTAEMAEHAKRPETIQAGHEMIITGYDDNAVVTGPNNEEHKGVLTLRNSWGSFAGDKGNYYMTYDHFKALVLEAHEYIPVAASDTNNS